MVKAMKRQIRSASGQFVRGLSSLLDVTGTPRRPMPPEPMDALRGDMERIGADMYRVIERERAREKAARKTITAAE